MSKLLVDEISDADNTGPVTVTDGAVVNRTGDGTIIDLQVGGTSVGTVGTESGSGFDAMYVANGDTGLIFQGYANDAIIPFTAASLDKRDAAIDLGYSGGRFKDLYLSGGVYLGGTGSANHLDDYEVGTFNIGFTGASFTIGSTTATYTKVGDTVTWNWFGIADIASASGNATITGLPFTVRNVDAGYTPMSMAHNDFFGGSATVGQSGYHIKNTTTGAFNNTGTTASATFVNGTGKYLMITGTYFTDS